MSYGNYISIVDEIKRRITIEQVFDLCFPGHRLTRRGDRLWACCPFHTEKTPSFYLDLAKNRFTCFGCHVHGDSIDLYAKANNLTLKQAIQQLAALLGISRDISPEAQKAAKKTKAKREHIATINQDIEKMVKEAREACFNTEQWLHLFKKHIYTEQDLDRPGPILALQNMAFIEHLGDLFINGTPLEQLEAAKNYRRWKACHQRIG